MILGKDLHTKRLSAGIALDVVAQRSGMDRTDISRIERQLKTASLEQLERIDAALDELINAKRQVEEYAARVGWPAAVGL